MFRFLDENRQISKGLVNRLINSIKEIGVIPSSFVLIDQDYFILDGQHRFLALKELNLPIPYVQINTINQEQIIKELNKNQLIWRLQDFINFYAEKGVLFHTTVRDFEKEHGLNISNSIVICSKNHTNSAKNIRNGNDVELNPNREKVVEFIRYCKDIPFCKSKNFITAVCILVDKATEDQIKKVKKYYMSIQEQPQVSMYKRVFENLANRYVKDEDNKLFL